MEKSVDEKDRDQFGSPIITFLLFLLPFYISRPVWAARNGQQDWRERKQNEDSPKSYSKLF